MTRDENPDEEPVEAPDERAEPSRSDPSDGSDGTPPPDENVAGYLLDALTDEERARFEDDLPASPATQAELNELAPVVALLPKVLELELDATGAIPAPSLGLRERVMAAVAEPVEAAPGVDDTFAGEETGGLDLVAPELRAEDDAEVHEPVEFASATSPARPLGRVRSGVQTVPVQPVPTPIQTLGQAPRSWLVAASLAVVSVAAVIWALALMGKVDDRNREIGAQSTELAVLRGQANATAFQLAATADGSPGASGTLFFSPADQRGVLEVRNMAPLPGGRVYQVWYVNAGSAPVPGTTLTVDPNGNGVVAVSPNAPTFTTVALTQEPDGGSAQPTTPIVLAGSLPGAAG